jgi:mannose-1-phosphate guanylyltransferase
LNGDICTDLDLTAMRAFHNSRGAAITIALHHVDDARAFGLVATDADGCVRSFQEKPTEEIPGDINAGTYLIDPAVLERWTPDREISIEHEIFPAVIEAGHAVFGYVVEAYWMDLGTPEKYLQAHFDLLAGRFRGLSYETPWIARGATVDPGATIGDRCCIGPEARVADGATVEDSVLLAGASIGTGATVRGSIVGPGAQVGSGAVIERCVLGAGSRVLDGLRLADSNVPTSR